jgi:hypothetical protein
MRDAAEARRDLVEFAFSMADQPLVERAIRRLEARGARAIVVLRVFGLASSFRGSVDRMLGLDVERGGVPDAAGHGHGHGHGDMGPPGARIHTAALLTTVGGLEDSPHFAAALLDRALALSRDPGHETVVLVAHGDGDDAVNARWRQILASLAEQMRAGDGRRFRAIEIGTWREDWPEQREPRGEGDPRHGGRPAADGGRAIVILPHRGQAPDPLSRRSHLRAGHRLRAPSASRPGSPAGRARRRRARRAAAAQPSSATIIIIDHASRRILGGEDWRRGSLAQSRRRARPRRGGNRQRRWRPGAAQAVPSPG